MLKLLLLFIIFFLIYKTVGIIPIILLFVAYFVFFYVYKKKYKISVITASTGGGKTLYCNTIAQKYVKKNKRIDKINSKLLKKGIKILIPKYNIYTTFYCKDCLMLTSNFYDFQFPENSILIIDEAQMSLDSRAVGQAVRSGTSTKLLGALSMHRHHKLDIYFITQQPEEIDVRVRRYCNELVTLENIIFFRRFYKVCKKLKISSFIAPLILVYYKWDKVSDYVSWLENRKNNNFSRSQFGARLGFKIIFKYHLDTYDTYQQDSFYASLLRIQDTSWNGKEDVYLDTGH